MRKLKLQVQLSIDGFLAGPNGEMDWMEWNWDDALKNYVQTLTGTIDTIVMGKSFAGGFIPHWANIATQPDNEEYEFAKIMTDAGKVIFSRSFKKDELPPSEWPNASMANTDLVNGINRLKLEEGKDIIAYGGSEFVSSLIAEDLIDELHLFINPVMLGKGLPVFHKIKYAKRLMAEETTLFDCGIVVVRYDCKSG